MKPLVILGDHDRFQKSVLKKATLACGIRVIDGRARGRPVPGAAYLAWDGRCIYDAPAEFGHLVPEGAALLNGRFDSDKRNVQAHMERVFGYTDAVDPLTWRGKGVIKHRLNSRHGGRIVEFPIDEHDWSKCYRRFIDNTCGDGELLDLRVVTVRCTAVLAYRKWRREEDRFNNNNLRAELVEPLDILTAHQIEACMAFCRSIGLDYGDLDILRERATGRLYIVDANNTPRGPPKALPAEQAELAVRAIGAAWISRVLD